MATTPIDNPVSTGNAYTLARWNGINTGDVGAALNVSPAAKITVGVVGTFAGTTVTWEWSPDGGTTWIPLVTNSGAAAALTAAGTLFIDGGGIQIRPNAAAGTAAGLVAWAMVYNP